MLITLTCICGHQHPIPNATPGDKFSCNRCGNALTVPALGIVATAKTKAKAAVKPIEATSSRKLGIVLLATGVLVLLAAGGGWLVWSLRRAKPNEMPQVAAKTDPEQRARSKIESPPIERKRPEPEKKQDPAVIEPTAVEPKKPVIEPVQPIDAPKPVMEPIAQVGELPNPFLLPIKQDPPAKIVAKKPVNVIEPLKLVWKLKEDDTFFQELMVTQKPTFKVQGIAIVSLLQYHIVSRFTVKKVNDDGSLLVEQKIESAKLVQADELTRPIVEGAVAKMPGTAFMLHLGSKMDVTKLEGNIGGPKMAHVAGGMGMQMASLLDRDGWMELAQATFFQVDKPLKVKDRWSKPLTHNWGSLGSWSGQIIYVYFGKQDNVHKVGYSLNLAYKAPGAGAAGMLKINGATFQPPQAEGMLLFDAAKGKVVAAEERFRVRGLLNVNLLGSNTPIEIEEDQHFLIRIHEKREGVK